jgi:hypothetical protein
LSEAAETDRDSLAELQEFKNDALSNTSAHTPPLTHLRSTRLNNHSTMRDNLPESSQAYKGPRPPALSFVPSLATPPVHSVGDSPPALPPTKGQIEWDWDAEHADRAREKRADASRAKHHGSRAGAGIDYVVFEVDRKLVKDIVAEKMGEPVGRIVFVGSGKHPYLD